MQLQEVSERYITISVTYKVDDELAQKLAGDPGWSAPDGSCEPPTSGLQIAVDRAEQSICEFVRGAFQSLDGTVVHSIAVISEPYDRLELID